MYIEDKDFVRGSTPMTKEEIRVLSISKMNIMPDFRVLDIGAGTGSVSIQLSKLCSAGNVIAIEKDDEALRLIVENKKKFRADNLHIVQGEAIQVQNSIKPYFSAIFVGGSGGSIEDIIKVYGNKLITGGRMVFNFITLKNLNTTLEVLQYMDYDVQCMQVSINRIKGKNCMIYSNNSIFIVTATKLQGKDFFK